MSSKNYRPLARRNRRRHKNRNFVRRHVSKVANSKVFRIVVGNDPVVRGENLFVTRQKNKLAKNSDKFKVKPGFLEKSVVVSTNLVSVFCRPVRHFVHCIAESAQKSWWFQFATGASLGLFLLLLVIWIGFNWF